MSSVALFNLSFYFNSDKEIEKQTKNANEMIQLFNKVKNNKLMIRYLYLYFI